VQLPREGYQTQYGDVVMPPSKITPTEQVTKGLGFQPTPFSHEMEYRQTEKRLKESTQQASSDLLTAIARNFTLADDARKQGDDALARRYDAANADLYAKNADQLSDVGIPDWQKVPAPQRSAIKQKVRSMLDYGAAATKSAGKLKRSAMQDYPLPH
jgi:hypothetical protein